MIPTNERTVVSTALSSPRDRESGAALMTAIAGLLILALIAAGLNAQTKNDLLIGRNAEISARHKYAAEAGIYLALEQLTRTDQKTVWPQNGAVVKTKFAEVSLRVFVQHERGKINLNKAPNDLLRRLMLRVCASETAAAQIMDQLYDFIDNDNEQRPLGLEKDDYPNASLFSVSELRRLPAITEEIFSRIKPHISVHAFNVTPDLRYASQTVLALRNGQDQDKAEIPADPQNEETSGVYTISTITMDGKQEIYQLNVLVYVTRDSQKPYVILDWRRTFADTGNTDLCTIPE